MISLFLKTHIQSISTLLKTYPESYHFSTSPKHRFGTSCCFPHLRLLTSLLTGHPASSTLCHLIVYSQQSSQCELLELSKMRLLLGSKPSNDFPSYSEPKPNSSHLPRRGSVQSGPCWFCALVFSFIVVTLFQSHWSPWYSSDTPDMPGLEVFPFVLSPGLAHSSHGYLHDLFPRLLLKHHLINEASWTPQVQGQSPLLPHAFSLL